MSRKNPFFVGTREQEYLNTIVMEQNEKTNKVKDAEKALDDAKKNVGNKEKELEATKQAEDLRQKADKIENDAKKQE